jgi:hypothetical protein
LPTAINFVVCGDTENLNGVGERWTVLLKQQ